MPTPTLEEYLETIYKLAQDGAVRPTQLAEALGVSGPTVTATLKRLESHDLVSREGTEVVLTDAGLAGALDIVRKHRVAERFLVDVLGLDWEAAHEDACLLEHALSGRVLAALETYLDNPDVCPHGHPIPGADGSVTQAIGRSLLEAEVGDKACVIRVAEEEDVLTYLGEIGLRPGAVVEIVESAPFGGPITLLIDGKTRAIAREIASSVTVTDVIE